MSTQTPGRHPAADDWYVETLHPHVAQGFHMAEVLYRDRTEHQDLVIFRNPQFGTVMALDGAIQVTTGDEFVYHEMIAHVPIIAHGAARRVLIIGGGDGGALRHVLMHPGVERATMVELDRTVVDLSLQHFPQISAGAFDDPRTELVFADGARYVAETDRRFDVIIVDSTDPVGPGAVLFTPEFYAACKRCLTDGGILVVQGGCPFVQPDELAMIAGNLRPSFADVAAYMITMPTYYGGFMTLGWATDDPGKRAVPLDDLTRRVAASSIAAPRYYSPGIHLAAFVLPSFVDQRLRAGLATVG